MLPGASRGRKRQSTSPDPSGTLRQANTVLVLLPLSGCAPDVDAEACAYDQWTDADGDGFGGAFAGAACRPIPGAVTNDDDCDDGDA